MASFNANTNNGLKHEIQKNIFYNVFNYPTVQCR